MFDNDVCDDDTDDADGGELADCDEDDADDGGELAVPLQQTQMVMMMMILMMLASPPQKADGGDMLMLMMAASLQVELDDDDDDDDNDDDDERLTIATTIIIHDSCFSVSRHRQHQPNEWPLPKGLSSNASCPMFMSRNKICTASDDSNDRLRNIRI